MPSPDSRSVDLPILTLGGKVSQFDPQTLPIGASPYNQDVAFSGVDPSGVGAVAGVMTRPGMSPFYAVPFAANPSVNYLKTFIDSETIIHLLSLDMLGNMRDESPCPIPPGVPAVIGSVVAACFAQSDSLLNREWIALSDPISGFGLDIPRQWDGTFFDRVSQVGPGAPPNVSGVSAAVPIATIAQPASVHGFRLWLWSAGPASRSAGNLFTVFYKLVSAGLPDPNIVVGNWVWLSGFASFGSGVNINGLYQITDVGQFSTAAGGTGGPLYYTFSVTAASSQFHYIFNPAGSYQCTLATVTLATPSSLVTKGSQIQIAGASVGSWDGDWTVEDVPPSSIMTVTSTQLAAGIATIGYQLQTNQATGNPWPQPNVGDLINITGTQNGGGVFNQTYATILSVTPAGGGGTLTIGINSVNVAMLADAGTITDTGTLLQIDPATLNPVPANPIFANSTGGTLSGIGIIASGLRQCAVAFVTREGYITQPSPPVTFNLSSDSAIVLSNIPIGPPNVIQRILMFTPVITAPATTGPFFYFDGPVQTPTDGTFPSMVINDNTTTTYTVDFVDAVLENGTPATNLFNLMELGECSASCAYADRMFWCGERNKVPNFLNLTFDGGFSNSGVPLGWSADPVNGVGGGQSPLPYWGGAYRLTGDGMAADLGMITQGAITDYLGVDILSIVTEYSVRVRLQKGGGIMAGSFVVDLFSPTLGILGTFSVDQSLIGPTYSEFIGVLVIPPPPTIPVDAILRVHAGTPLTNGGWIDADCLEVFPTFTPFNTTLIRGSYALDPESFDQVTGFMIAGSENGDEARALFRLLDNKLYIVKERSLYSTQDDGANEPSLWTINTVSDTVGTGSSRGVGVGESWAIIAHKTGAYIFWGGEPVKISQEIQPDWDTINWNYDHTIYVVVDTANKRIHIGAPTGAATTPNVEFVCDYSQLANSEGQTSAQDIAAHPQAYYSVYNPTRVVAPGKARKWTIWNLKMNCATLAVRSDGSYHLLRGNGTSTGKVYDQLPTQLSDDGVAINSQYQTAYMPQVEDEQALQLGSHRKLFKYLTGYAYGSGLMSWTIFGAQDQRGLPLSPLNLSNPALYGDFEKNMNFVAERGSFLFGTNAVGAWFKLTKLIPNLQREIVTPVRGVS